MTLTEKDITVAGVNCKEFLSLTGYLIFCQDRYKDFNYLHIDPVNTPLEELRQKIVAEQKKLVVILPNMNEEDKEVSISWHCDDTEQLKARELELKKIFRACFIADLVPIENELSGDDEVEQLGMAVALKLYSQEKMVSYVNY